MKSENRENEQGTSFDNMDDDYRVTERERVRRQLARDMEAFIASGGRVKELDITARAENLSDY